MIVTLIGICVALAVPSYSHWAAKTALKKAVLEAQSQLSLARMTARDRSAPITVIWSLNGTTVTATPTDSTGNPAGIPMTFDAHITGLAVTDSSGALVSSGQVSFSSLGFRKGGPLNQNQLIQLTNSHGITYAIAVTPGGRISWCPQSTCT